jgi:Divergent InlB B-repeat domain
MLAAIALAVGCGGSNAPVTNTAGADAGPSDGGTGKRALAVIKSGSGTIRSSPSGIDCGVACSATFDPGTSVSLSAIADAGWTFVGWTGACGGAGACTVALSADATVYATFQTSAPPGSHKLTVAHAGDGHVSSSPAGIDCGTTCMASYSGSPRVVLTAAANAGSQFSGWSGACTGGGTCTVTMDRDLAVTATFADDCAGFKPGSPGSPVSESVPKDGSSDAQCVRGTGDGSGNVAWGWKGNHDTVLSFASSTGAFHSGSPGNFKGIYTDLIGQLDGFEGVDSESAGSWALVVLGPNGDKHKRVESTTVPATGAIQANDPTGGVIIFDDENGKSVPRQLIAFDAAGTMRWSKPVAATMGAAFGVDRQGNSLLLFDGESLFGSGATAGQWVDHDGKPGSVFNANVQYGLLRNLYPRVGSGLFYQSTTIEGGTIVHNNWIAQFDALATQATPPPEWLVARPDTKISMAHGGRAYAMLPSQSRVNSPDCSQTIEVVATSGKSCGTAKFTVSQSTCTTLSIDVGYDGTVLQQLPTAREEQPTGGKAGSCTMHWWAGFLR